MSHARLGSHLRVMSALSARTVEEASVEGAGSTRLGRPGLRSVGSRRAPRRQIQKPARPGRKDGRVPGARRRSLFVRNPSTRDV